MSYTTHFREKVRGTVTIHYTVSQNTAPGTYSKTQSYEQDVDIDITVDTAPFDHSIEGCTSSVNNLTGSVVAAGTAEAATKLTNADKLGRTVTKGFFGLVEQNFRVQALEEKAMLNAVSGELIEQAKELSHKKNVMTGDYNRIKRRYIDLFSDLDNELHTRIFNLLKPCFQFTENAGEEVNRNIRTSLLATSMVGHKENMGLQAQLSSARMKERAVKLIGNAKQFLLGQKWLERQIEEMLVDKVSQGTLLIPVIMVQKRNEDNSAVLEWVMNREASNLGIKESDLRSALGQHPLSGEKKDELCRSRISDDFNSRINRTFGTSDHERKVAVLMRSLYERTEF